MVGIVTVIIGYSLFAIPPFAGWLQEYFPIICLVVALFLILYSFSSRGSAKTAWEYLVLAHFFIIAGVGSNVEQIETAQLVMYGSGVLVAAVLGFVCLQRIYSIDKDISLDRFHGYVYEQGNTALLFLLSAIGLLGFPITAAFIGIDVFFTHIGAEQPILIALAALCFLFIELAAIRIYCRIFLGLHKKLDHPLAFRSS